MGIGAEAGVYGGDFDVLATGNPFFVGEVATNAGNAELVVGVDGKETVRSRGEGGGASPFACICCGVVLVLVKGSILGIVGAGPRIPFGLPFVLENGDEEELEAVVKGVNAGARGFNAFAFSADPAAGIKIPRPTPCGMVKPFEAGGG